MPKDEKDNNKELLDLIMKDADIKEISTMIESGVDICKSSFVVVHTAINKDRKDVVEIFRKILPDNDENKAVIAQMDLFLSGDSASAAKVFKKRKKKKVRCAKEGCKFSKTLYMFDCRCGNKYCGPHLQSEQHGCTFDYKEEGRKKLEEDNPRVVGDKLGNRL